MLCVKMVSFLWFNKVKNSFKDSGILDSVYSFHICSNKDWLNTYKVYDEESLVLINDDALEIDK